MLFNSLHFMIFFPVVTAIYFILPYRYRWGWLLGASYYFYMNWNPKYIILILTSTIITYLSGILIYNSSNDRKRRIYLWISLISNLGILFLFKYYNFFNATFITLFSKFNIEWKGNYLDILLPVGISFYTFQALSYSIDVYQRKIEPEKHFGRYALFVSFFPQLVAGPIERSTHLLPQFKNKYSFDYNRIKDGFVLMLWGFLKKVVIADRLALLVNTVYNNPYDYKGFQLIIATIFFSFQIYCDFSSYSDIAIGSAQVMGYDIMQNFNKPYFAKSISEFWRRWHISLSTWFKDYLYIPLGGNRVSKLKFYRNILIVFLVSGLWHGASWNFVIWGLLHAIYQIFSIETKPIKEKLIDLFNINTNSFSYSLYKILVTFTLVSFAWIFFRANNFADAQYIIRNLFVFNPEVLFNDNLYKLGLDVKEFALAIRSIILLLAIQLLQNTYYLRDKLKEQNLVFRWLIYLGTIFIILIWGVYGHYDETQFIYFQF